MTQTPAERVRTLLLRADNVSKNVVPGGDPEDRRRRARAALEEAERIARDPALDPRLRELVGRRLAALESDG